MPFPYPHRRLALNLCSMTTSAALITSNREGPLHAEPTHDGKTAGPAAARHARSPEGAGTRSGCERVEFPGTIGFADGSAMELAGESGVDAKTESRQAAGSNLRGGH